MKKCILLFFALATIVSQLSAQNNADYRDYCVAHKKAGITAAKPTVADVAEDDYDVSCLRFSLNLTDTSAFISGNVIAVASVTAPAMSQYTFELNALIVDSAKVNGVLMPVTTTGMVHKIMLTMPLSAGATFTAQVYYHGYSPTTSPSYGGLVHSVSAGGTHNVYSFGEPYGAANWWPCKQSLNDKIDSVEMLVTVPSGVMAGSNGLLINTDNVTDPLYTTYHWKTNYPIDYYLISIAVARYGEYKNYMHFTGSTDSMLIQNFIMDTATFNPTYKIDVDSIQYIIDYFSTVFGRYPFWQEKYGMCFTNYGGGMEHQTMTTMCAIPYKRVMAHELAHQWFGDNVTQKSWGDIWLSEGFASFSEQLFIAHFYGQTEGTNARKSYLSSGLSSVGYCSSVYVYDTSSHSSIFTSSQYSKAEVIINTLWLLAPTDSLFFKVLRTYQQTYAKGNSSTNEFKAITESIYGFNLDTFFNQWIYGSGYPIFKSTWNQVGSTVYVKLIQSQSCSSYTNHFSTPVQVRLTSGSVDTSIVLYNSVDTQVYTIEWPLPITSVTLNPDAWTFMKTTGATSRDPSLVNVKEADKSRIRIFPNPSANYWIADGIPTNTALQLQDVLGNVVWSETNTREHTYIPAANLPAGNYMLKITGETSDHVKLVRW